jgi:hypothetical protein
MLGSLTQKVSGLLSGARGMAGAHAKGLASGAGSLVASSGAARRGIASAVRFGAAHPGVVGMGLGAAGGYMATGDIGGAFTGAIAGGLGGRAGWNVYQQKVGRKSGGLLSQFGRARQRLSARVGRGITGAAPGIAQAYGPKMGTTRGAMGIQKVFAGQARNLGGKRLGAQVVGAGMMLGAGVLAGSAYGMGGALIGSLGNTFGSQMRSSYGNAFSGMGNGTITGY